VGEIIERAINIAQTDGSTGLREISAWCAQRTTKRPRKVVIN
jgi:hypothetical protein